MSNLFAYTKAAIATVESPLGYGARTWLSGHKDCPYCETQLAELGSFHVDQRNLVPVNDPEHGPSFCTSCGCRTAQPDQGRPARKGDDGIEFFYPKQISPLERCSFRVATCKRCGWWCAVEDADTGSNGFAGAATGILELFEVDSLGIPMQVLRNELPRFADRIHDVHPRKMELLVGSVLAGVFDCEVHQLGYTHDGNIDLILLNGETQIAVEVKRRSKVNATESVKEVRAFLGAAMLKGHRDLIMVSTAQKFSKVAQRDSDTAVAKQLVNSFELIDRPRFQELMRRQWSDNNWQIGLNWLKHNLKKAKQ